MTTLVDLVTLRIGDPIVKHVRVSMTDALVGAVAATDTAGGSLLVVGGGSNPLTSDAPLEGTVVDMQPFDKVVSIVHEDPAGSIVIRVGVGMVWDALVSWMLSGGLCDLRAFLSVPGIAGASPVQNVGAYDHEVSETIGSVKAYDRLTGTVVCLLPSDLGSVYYSSATKRSVGESSLGDRPWGPAGR